MLKTRNESEYSTNNARSYVLDLPILELARYSTFCYPIHIISLIHFAPLEHPKSLSSGQKVKKSVVRSLHDLSRPFSDGFILL